MKQAKIIYWTTTGLIFAMEGIIPALTSQTELALEGIRHLGYPAYFGNVLVIFKVLGALTLIIPKVPARLKYFAYAGFTFNFIFASISHFVVDGFDFQGVMPLIILGILALSYHYYQKLNPNE